VTLVSDAKAEILARIGRALADRPGPVEPSRGYQQAGTVRPEDPVALFAERVADYQAVVTRCSRSEVVSVIREAVGSRTRMVVPPGFPPEWSLPWLVPDAPALSVDELDQVDGVLTTCALAIAETGTIVLDAGPGQGRRVLTLVPDYHLVIVRAEQIVASVPDAVAALDPLRPLTWISGPSATSDIELSRVEGVHGPRRLQVVIAS
jgi:L-lactate dehydrogenase complex protein LldG